MAHPTHEFKSMTEAYETFSKKCIPVETGVRQRDAMRKSFFAGMISMRGMALQLAELPENEAIKRFNLWEFEAIEYTMKTMEEALK